MAVVRSVSLITAATLIAAAMVAGSASAADPQPMYHVAATTFVSPGVLEGDAVIHDFTVDNRGDAPLVISRVRTG